DPRPDVAELDRARAVPGRGVRRGLRAGDVAGLQQEARAVDLDVARLAGEFAQRVDPPLAQRDELAVAARVADAVRAELPEPDPGRPEAGRAREQAHEGGALRREVVATERELRLEPRRPELAAVRGTAGRAARLAGFRSLRGRHGARGLDDAQR